MENDFFLLRHIPTYDYQYKPMPQAVQSLPMLPPPAKRQKKSGMHDAG